MTDEDEPTSTRATLTDAFKKTHTKAGAPRWSLQFDGIWWINTADDIAVNQSPMLEHIGTAFTILVNSRYQLIDMKE